MKTNEPVVSRLDNETVFKDLTVLGYVAIVDEKRGDTTLLDSQGADRLLTQLLARKERINNERQNQDR